MEDKIVRNNSSRVYSIWCNMRQRSENPNHPRYPRYGGRGITVCEDWHYFLQFREWAFSNGYEDTLSIDRIDNNAGYTPSNCRWATQKEQSANKTYVFSSLFRVGEKRYFFRGEKVSMRDISNRFGISYHTLKEKMSRQGSSIDDIVESLSATGSRTHRNTTEE